MTLLQRQMPFHPAMGMLLTGKRIKAAEAFRIGLVNEVVPRAELDAAVARWVDEILACAPLSVRAIKQVVRRTAQLSAAEARDSYCRRSPRPCSRRIARRACAPSSRSASRYGRAK